MSLINQRQLHLNGLGAVAILSDLNDAIVQCGILIEGVQQAHLFLLKDGVLALTELNLPNDAEPSDEVLRAIALIMVHHLRACREGRSL